MNKTIKLISVILIALVLTFAVSNICFASPGDLINGVENASNDPNNAGDLTKINTTAGKILKLIRNASIILGVILIAVLGVKFMLGSAEEKAEYKKSFMPLIIGIVVVMGATSIATLLFSTFG